MSKFLFFSLCILGFILGDLQASDLDIFKFADDPYERACISSNGALEDDVTYGKRLILASLLEKIHHEAAIANGYLTTLEDYAKNLSIQDKLTGKIKDLTSKRRDDILEIYQSDRHQEVQAWRTFHEKIEHAVKYGEERELQQTYPFYPIIPVVQAMRTQGRDYLFYSREKKDPAQCLPVEIFHIILGFLDSKDRLSSRLVSKRWHAEMTPVSLNEPLSKFPQELFSWDGWGSLHEKEPRNVLLKHAEAFEQRAWSGSEKTEALKLSAWAIYFYFHGENFGKVFQWMSKKEKSRGSRKAHDSMLLSYLYSSLGMSQKAHECLGEISEAIPYYGLPFIGGITEDYAKKVFPNERARNYFLTEWTECAFKNMRLEDRIRRTGLNPILK